MWLFCTAQLFFSFVACAHLWFAELIAYLKIIIIVRGNSTIVCQFIKTHHNLYQHLPPFIFYKMKYATPVIAQFNIVYLLKLFVYFDKVTFHDEDVCAMRKHVLVLDEPNQPPVFTWLEFQYDAYHIPTVSDAAIQEEWLGDWELIWSNDEYFERMNISIIQEQGSHYLYIITIHMHELITPFRRSVLPTDTFSSRVRPHPQRHSSV